MAHSVNFDRAADFYDATRAFPEGVDSQIGELIADTASLKHDVTVLEIGIGTGRIALPLSQHVSFVAGVDISHKMLQVLQEKRQQSAVYPAQADGMALPYPDNCFDAVVIVNVLHLVPYPEKILTEMARILKPGGIYLHCFPDSGESDLSDPVIRAQITSRPKSRSGTNRKKLPELINAAGWQLIRDAQLSYTVTELARDVYDNVRNRAWSSLWTVSDNDLQVSVDAIAAAIEEHHDGNYNADIRYQQQFIVQIFQQTI